MTSTAILPTAQYAIDKFTPDDQRAITDYIAATTSRRDLARVMLNYCSSADLKDVLAEARNNPDEPRTEYVIIFNANKENTITAEQRVIGPFEKYLDAETALEKLPAAAECAYKYIVPLNRA